MAIPLTIKVTSLLATLMKPEKIPKKIVDDLVNTLNDLGYKTEILESTDDLYVIWKSNDGYYFCASDYFPKRRDIPSIIGSGYLYMDSMLFCCPIDVPISKDNVAYIINELKKNIAKLYDEKNIAKFLLNSDKYFEKWKKSGS